MTKAKSLLKKFKLTPKQIKTEVELNLKEKTDAELVSLSLKNPDHFAELVDRYEKKLFRYVRRLSGLEAESIEDVLQEAFIKIYTNLNDFDPKFNFSSWTYRITHNETINYLKKNKKQIVLPLETDDKETMNLIDALESETDISSDMVQKEMGEKVRQGINLLPEKYREILVLRYMEDLDYKEISEILRIPMGTVATTINRAKEKFKKIAFKLHLNQT